MLELVERDVVCGAERYLSVVAVPKKLARDAGARAFSLSTLSDALALNSLPVSAICCRVAAGFLLCQQAAGPVEQSLAPFALCDI